MFNNNQAKKLTLGLGLGAVLTVGSGFNSSILAQHDNNNYPSNEKDSLYGDAPAGLNPLDLMHRAQQLDRRSAAEFNAESQSQIDSSVADFKRLQQQRILEQQSAETSQQRESIEIVE
ncbi:hypothetical protein IQ255_25240 [Pleurocapsales cyanobacterium LEGE 10410]|nr:hypothetical protein [Pleurocapsales cyanobacterium LEGE 10410]